MSSRIFIVIPVHNNLELTKNCVKSLLNQEYKNYEIVVVDDGSSDGTSEYLKKNFNSIKVIPGDGNLWWTESTNLGVKYAIERASKDDFVLTLNNDLEVESNYLASLVDVYMKNAPCLVGSVSVYMNDTEKIDFLGKKWSPILAQTRPTLDLFNKFSYVKDTYEVIDSDLLTGRGTLIPVSLFSKIGLFDSYHFPQYVADYDFSIRAKKEGYKLIVSTKAYVKSVVENTGLNYKLRKISYSTFFKSLVSIKSPIQLRARYYWAIKHSPFSIMTFFLDVLRIFVSYHRDLVLSLFNKSYNT